MGLVLLMVILAVTSGHTLLLVQLMPVPVHSGHVPALVPTALNNYYCETAYDGTAGGNCFVMHIFS